MNDKEFDSYNKKGFLSPIKVLQLDEANVYRNSIENIEKKYGGNLLPEHRSKSHLLFKWLDDIIRDPRILDPVAKILGSNILCWNTVFWIKDKQSENFVSWHQDKHYWGLDTEDLVSVWLALSPASIESGCMKVIPESHKKGSFSHEDTNEKNNMLTRGQYIYEGIDESKAEYMDLKTGEMSMHNYCLVHSSGINKSSERRIGVSMHFIPPDCKQTLSNWDTAALVRGEDNCNNFTHTPIPKCDFDQSIMDFYNKATQANRKILYAGSKEEKNNKI